MLDPRQTRRPASALLAQWWRDDVCGGINHEEVIARVRDDGGWSAHFLVMTILSAGIAVLGLLLSSPAVVIGAMLISPLMGPIIGAGFGVATFDAVEIRRALLALAGGTVLAIAFCAGIVLLSPIQTVTSEIALRTRPNLFDLLVALLAGLAGTYAVIRGRHGAIVGVAIATALMPPLAVMGFGLATANWAVLSGSSLLFFTNLMTIGAAAAVLARLYGFATDLSPRQTRLQIVFLLGSLAVLTVPLALSLKKIAWEALATSQAKSALADAFGPQARVSNLEMHFDAKPIEVDATVLTPTYRQNVERTVAATLQGELGTPVVTSIDQVRTSDGAATALDLGRTQQPKSAAGDRITQELAILAGVKREQVLVDREHKTAQVYAAQLPAADLATYRELERRAAAAEPEWTIVLIPPLLDLPDLSQSPTTDETVQTAIWAAQRLHLPITVTGPKAETEALVQQLRSAGVTADIQNGTKLGLKWGTGGG